MLIIQMCTLLVGAVIVLFMGFLMGRGGTASVHPVVVTSESYFPKKVTVFRDRGREQLKYSGLLLGMEVMNVPDLSTQVCYSLKLRAIIVDSCGEINLEKVENVQVLS